MSKRDKNRAFAVNRACISEPKSDHEKRIARLTELLYFLSCQRHSDPMSSSTTPMLPETKTQEHPT
jgi:hypothetical protein